MTGKLTVIIPCKDEEANIRGCIHSARKVADEIVIADSGSTDRTLEIVRDVGGSRIIEREYVNSGDFKNWAIPQATRPWVLILDADERITDCLANEIRDLLQRGPDHDGYWIYRASFFMGRRVRFSGWQNDRVLRLFRRDLGIYQGDTDHAEVAISTGRVSRLRNRLLHYSYWTYHDYFQRLQRYSTYQALKWQEQGRPISMPKLFFNLPLRFLQLFILRLGFLDGLAGFQVCTLTAVYSFSKQACLWQLRHGRTREEANQDAADVLITDETTLPQDLAESSSNAATADWRRPTEVPECHHNGAVDNAGVSGVSPFAHVLRSMSVFRHASGKERQEVSEAVCVHRSSMPRPDAEGPHAHEQSGLDADRNEVTHGG